MPTVEEESEREPDDGAKARPGPGPEDEDAGWAGERVAERCEGDSEGEVAGGPALTTPTTSSSGKTSVLSLGRKRSSRRHVSVHSLSCSRSGFWRGGTR